SPCSSYPCHNGGACEANHRDNTFECICESGFTGEYCEKALKACKDIYDVHKQVALNVSKLVPLIISEKPVSILCQMGDFGCGDGGWTPVMKIDGSKIDQQLKFIVINKQADSLYSLITDGKYRNTSLGRDTWKKLLGNNTSLQLKCNEEGVNSGCAGKIASARIGIVTNNEDDCISCDSRLGFGTEGVVDKTKPVETRLNTSQIMETNTSKPWVMYWFSERSLHFCLTTMLRF
ncbi:Sushi, nidogen and EGF-like domain-containing protein 1, partial [Stylophora pistillata]